MKKTITILVLIISLNASAQKPKADTTFTDSTYFMSISDIRNYLNSIQDKVSYKQFNDFTNMLQPLISASQKDWEEKKHKK